MRGQFGRAVTPQPARIRGSAVAEFVRREGIPREQHVTGVHDLTPPVLARIPDQQLTQCDATVIGRYLPMGDDLKTFVVQTFQCEAQQ